MAHSEPVIQRASSHSAILAAQRDSLTGSAIEPVILASRSLRILCSHLCVCPSPPLTYLVPARGKSTVAGMQPFVLFPSLLREFHQELFEEGVELGVPDAGSAVQSGNEVWEDK